MFRKLKFGAIPSNYIPLILYIVITGIVYFFIIKKETPVCPIYTESSSDATTATTTAIITFKQFSRSGTYYQLFTVPDNVSKINILCIGGGGGGATNGATDQTSDNVNGDYGNATYVYTSDLKTKIINANRGLAGISSSGSGNSATNFNFGGAGGTATPPDSTLGTSRGSIAGSGGSKGNGTTAVKDANNVDVYPGGTGGSVGNISGTNITNATNSKSNFGAAGKYYIGSDLSSTADKWYSYSKNGVKISASGYGGGGQIGAGGGGGGAVSWINGYEVKKGDILLVVVGGGGINGGDGRVVISWGKDQEFKS